MSPEFIFRFDSILRQRKILEDNEAKEFARLSNIYNAECDKLTKLVNKFGDTQKELSEKKRNNIDIKELKRYYTYLDALKTDMGSQRLRIKGAETKMEAQRKKLVIAQKNKKMIDKLKENDFNLFKEEERKNEIKTVDDINTIKVARDQSRR